MSSFTPRRVKLITPSVIAEFLGTATLDIATQFVRQLAPFAPDAVIHDNGCGWGAVTQAIMATNPPETIHIEATDVNSTVLAGLSPQAATEAWPVSVSEMNSTALSFPDNYFSHSILSFVVLQAWRDDAKLASEIFRTLKQGGLAVVTTFEDVPTMKVFKNVHQHFRGADAEVQEMMKADGYGGQEVRVALSKAGFMEANIMTEKATTRVQVQDARRWCEIGWSLSGGPCEEGDEHLWDTYVPRVLAVSRSSTPMPYLVATATLATNFSFNLPSSSS
jgi:ubiquinone/menaquinone biosynthesis C-methylase UbiE